MIGQTTSLRIRVVQGMSCSLLLGLLAACGGGGSGDKNERVDGGPHDAATQPPDAGTEAGAPDSGTDASTVVTPPDAAIADGGSDGRTDAATGGGTDAATVTPSDAGSGDGGLDGGQAPADGGFDASDASDASDDGGDGATVDGSTGRGLPCELTGEDTCQSGLSCAFVLNNPVEVVLCPHIASPGGADGCCLPTRGLGQHCGIDANGGPECDTGLACFLPSNEAGRTVTCSGLSNCCIPSGGLNQICREDDSCDGDLVCTNATSEAQRAACGNSPFCCLPVDLVD